VFKRLEDLRLQGLLPEQPMQFAHLALEAFVIGGSMMAGKSGTVKGVRLFCPLDDHIVDLKRLVHD